MEIDSPQIAVELVRSAGPRHTETVTLQLQADATVQTALEAAAWVHSGLAISIWGRLAALDQPLRDRDRIELTRPLKVDPKEARRLRYNKQGRRNKPQPKRKTPG
jgi:uncharacterized protein